MKIDFSSSEKIDAVIAKNRKLHIVLSCFVNSVPAVLFVCSILALILHHSMDNSYARVNGLIMTCGSFFMCILFYSKLAIKSVDQVQKRHFLWLCFIMSMILFLDNLVYSYVGQGGHAKGQMAITTVDYILTVCYWWACWQYLKRAVRLNVNQSKIKRENKVFDIIVSLMSISVIALILANEYLGLVFYFDNSDGTAIYTDLNIVLMLLSFVLYLLFEAYVFSKKMPLRKKLALASYTLLPTILGIVNLVLEAMDFRTEIDALYDVVNVAALYVVYFNYDSTLSMELLKKQAENTEMTTSLLLSQMQPHFLYNALTAIRHLCKKAPEKAYDALGDFSQYLRLNLDSINTSSLIPFTKELEHVKSYCAIEQLRFGDELEISYDVQFSNFMIPPLTVQPIVENAVRYGACMNENGGKVKVSVTSDNGYAIIKIADNGPGIDVNKIDETKSHIGISNVKERLALLCNGELNIDSSENGTTVTMRIFGGGGGSKV